MLCDYLYSTLNVFTDQKKFVTVSLISYVQRPLITESIQIG